MAPYKKILVALDGSMLAEQALIPAIAMAKYGGQLLLVRVLTPIYLWAPFVEIEPAFEVAQQRNEAEIEQYLADVRNRLLEKHPSLQIDTVLLTGHVAESIIDYADKQNVDLIIISSHGRSGLSRWVYGSVAERVLRGARCCSTLVVRGEPEGKAATPAKKAKVAIT